MSDTGISVVVCTYNGRATIVRTLAALQAQTGLEGIPFEVILVDNACTDDTAAEAARSWRHDAVPLRIVREERLGLSFARQAGCRAARHAFVCWADDDNFLSSGYLDYGLDLMSRFPRAGVCGGCGVPLLASEPPSWFSAQTAAYALGPQGEEEGAVSTERGFVYGGGAIFRRAALDDLERNSFPALLSGRRGMELNAGEDVETCYALRLLGWEIVQSPDLLFQHVIPDSRLSWNYCERLFQGFGKADVVLSLYRVSLRPRTLKRRLQGWFPKFDARKRLRRAAQRDALRSRPGEQGSPERLRQSLADGRRHEIARLSESGDLWNYLARIREFERRSRDSLNGPSPAPRQNFEHTPARIEAH